MLKFIVSALSLAAAVAFVPACGDSSGDGDDDGDDDGAGNSGNQGSGNSGNEGTGNSGNEGTGNSGNSGTGNSGNSGTGNSGNSGTGNSGNSGTGGDGGEVVENCSDLCALAPVDNATGQCVNAYIVSQGYDVEHPACSDPNTPTGCLACYGAIDVSDPDCVAAYDLCF